MQCHITVIYCEENISAAMEQHNFRILLWLAWVILPTNITYMAYKLCFGFTAMNLVTHRMGTKQDFVAEFRKTPLGKLSIRYPALHCTRRIHSKHFLHITYDGIVMTNPHRQFMMYNLSQVHGLWSFVNAFWFLKRATNPRWKLDFTFIQINSTLSYARFKHFYFTSYL